jgi:outer membrane protein
MMPKVKCLPVCWILLLLAVPVWGDANGPTVPEKLTLDQCIETALAHNQKKQISQLAAETAEYQYKQALSAYWPQISFESGYNHFDQDINFIFPQRSGRISVSGLGPAPIAGDITIPQQDVTVMNQDNVLSRLKMVYPLFTGGLRSAMARRGAAGVTAARQALRRTELELILDVKRMYYGAVLARRLADIGTQTLARLQATSDLTKTLYSRGSGSVTRRDYLRSQIVLDSARAIVDRLTAHAELADAALANTMGLDWDDPVEPAEISIPYEPLDVDVHQMVADAYRFNPDWQQMAAAIEAYQAQVSAEKAKLWPQVAVSGTLWRWDTSMDSGLATDDNKQGWSVGVGLRLPLFSGFLSTNRIKAAQTRLKSMQAGRILLKKGLGLQIKSAFIMMDGARKARTAEIEAAQRGKEHRELTERAYMQQMVSTADVLESQILDALTEARSETAQYEYALARFQIDFLVGRRFNQWFSDNMGVN